MSGPEPVSESADHATGAGYPGHVSESVGSAASESVGPVVSESVGSVVSEPICSAVSERNGLAATESVAGDEIGGRGGDDLAVSMSGSHAASEDPEASEVAADRTPGDTQPTNGDVPHSVSRVR
jgi:hypothetical protein